MHIYIKNLLTLTIYAILGLVVFTAWLYATRKYKVLTKIIAALILIVAMYGILFYSVLGRTPSDNHTIVFATHNSESAREMFMNAMLYYPLGLSLTVLIGPWSILGAFLSSALIESWQYFAGTGLAQGTDVVMNTLGATIGVLPYLIVMRIVKRQEREMRQSQEE